MEIGTQVRDRSTGEIGVVLEAPGDGGLIVVAFPGGRKTVALEDVYALGPDPGERLASGDLGPATPYGLRLQALYLKHAYKYDPAFGLSNARVEPQLHQVYVAHRVTNKLQPRMILADEVGLGKTIEAGLVIKELRARGLAGRTLIVCPAGLVNQWQSELRSKFNEEFEVFDSVAVKQYGKRGANPWLRNDSVICSLPFAAREKNAERIVEAGWDLVVFDEAHRVRRSLQGKKITSTQAYRLADELKEVVDGLLLLTATPMQLHQFELFSLIELVEPGLFPRVEQFELRRRELPRLNDLMRSLQGWAAIDEAEQATVIADHQALLSAVVGPQADVRGVLDDPVQRAETLDLLADRHPLAGVLVRNRKAEIGGFTGREAHKVSVDLTPDEEAVYEAVTDYIQDQYGRAILSKNRIVGFLMVTYQKMLASSSHAIRASFQKRIRKLKTMRAEHLEQASRPRAGSPDELRDEIELTENLFGEYEGMVIDIDELDAEINLLEGLVSDLGELQDSKAAKLIELIQRVLRERPDEKFLVFTQFIETQEFLIRLLGHNGVSAVGFNGQMRLEDKEDAVAQFRDRVQVLVSTEAGGEGRNFQFAHLLVNYDLPWNPMRVEQRIGRLDRIGQKQTVFIYNLACKGTIEDRVVEVLEKRIGLFQESVGSLDPILGEVERDIERLVMEQADRLDEEFEQFEIDLQKRVRRAREQEVTLADFALDRSSFRQDVANELLGRRPLAHAHDLELFADRTLRYYGGMLSEHPDGGMVVTLSPRLSQRLKTHHRALRGVFDPAVAREREELDFLAFGHPVVDAIVDLPIDFEPVDVGVRRVVGTGSDPRVEVIWELGATGLHPIAKLRRHVIGPDLIVRSAELVEPPAFDDSPGADAGVMLPDWAAVAVEASKALAREEFQQWRQLAAEQHEEVRAERLARAQRIFEYRRVRYQSRIDDYRAWIERVEAQGTERERRVLPARRGLLASEEDKLRLLEVEFAEQERSIRDQLPGAQMELLAAGLVVGE